MESFSASKSAVLIGTLAKKGWNVPLASTDFSRLPAGEEDYVTSAKRVLLPLLTKNWTTELDNAIREFSVV